jgi:uncharacterized protein YggT (Ycf19 family)
MFPAAEPSVAWLEEGLLIAAGFYLTLKYLLLACFLIHFIHNFVYIGNVSFLHFINLTVQRLLVPLRWLPIRTQRVDFTPVGGIVLVLGLAMAAERFLPRAFLQIPW